MTESENDIISYGQYVLFQRKDYKKLHLLSEKTDSFFMGKDKVEISIIVGKKIGTTFKMIPKVGFNRQFCLQECSINEIVSVRQSLKCVGSGVDNRSISDDGSSQLLTSNCIEELRDCGTAPTTIIEQLVENSKTFQIKTEYSQQKYIKKKEKKYFEFITVHYPTIRMLADILYERDIPKSIGIRIDTLSQMSTALNLQPDGKYLLVENGYSGIVAATLLNSLSGNGRLVHITPSNQNQKQAVLAMNFTSTQLDRIITVRLSTLLDLLSKRNLSEHDSGNSNSSIETESILHEENMDKLDNSCSVEDNIEDNATNIKPSLKRKQIEQCPENPLHKKPKWSLEAEQALAILDSNVDGIVIACKEFSSSILDTLLLYLLPSRPFVVYSLYQEPLVMLYLMLKPRHDIVHLKISETWLRPYQILPDRSHPFVTISSSSGYLLTGLKVIS